MLVWGFKAITSSHNLSSLKILVNSLKHQAVAQPLRGFTCCENNTTTHVSNSERISELIIPISAEPSSLLLVLHSLTLWKETLLASGHAGTVNEKKRYRHVECPYLCSHPSPHARKKNLLFPPFPLRLTVCLFDEMTESYCRCPPLTSKVSLFIKWLIGEFHVDSGSWGSRTGQESSCKSTPARTVGCWTFSFVCDADNMSVMQFWEKKMQLSFLICVISRNCQMLWTKSERSCCFYNLLYGINDIKNMEDNHTEIKAMEYIVCADASIHLLCHVWSAFVFQTVQT